MSLKKVFKVNGPERVTFGADSIDQIKEWLGDVDLDFAMLFARKVDDDPVFGKAVSFPASIVEEA